jgi:hypothetical protein
LKVNTLPNAALIITIAFLVVAVELDQVAQGFGSYQDALLTAGNPPSLADTPPPQLIDLALSEY